MAQIAAPAEFIIAADSRAYEPKANGDAVCDTVQVQYWNKGKSLWLPAEPEFRKTYSSPRWACGCMARRSS